MTNDENVERFIMAQDYQMPNMNRDRQFGRDGRDALLRVQADRQVGPTAIKVRPARGKTRASGWGRDS